MSFQNLYLSNFINTNQGSFTQLWKQTMLCMHVVSSKIFLAIKVGKILLTTSKLNYFMREYPGNCTASTFNELYKYWTVLLCFDNWFNHIVESGWDILHSAIASCRISQPSSTIWFHHLPKHTSAVQYILILNFRL